MPSLTQPEAVERAGLLTVTSYEMDVDLTGDAERFRSTTTIRFSAAVPGAATFVEVRPLRLGRATLNGADLDPATLAGGRLALPALAADNVLVVEAEYGYSHDSEGMHRFVDPADDAVYVYAQPSITQAPRFMACFDQPDLKAPVTLWVTADPTWRVRANAEGEQVAPGRWRFPPTAPLATYLITLAAGPFHEIRTEHDGIPLGLYARASLAEPLARDAAELFEITAGCLDRYHQLFGIRYPFGGYDQVFAPEFSWGAMEFPGCVLIRDELVFRSAVTDTEREHRAVLMAHEMAHMWFGNLVTMRWWDDLWLNESFADYMGYRLAAEATRWRSAWTTFSMARKTWGYAADQRPSTHPVAATGVVDTDAALANFDGISYAKGSAVLRQLVAWVGDEAFLAGLRTYFDAHAYGNATLEDLLTALSRASGRDLSGWAKVWLRQPGVDTLAPAVTLHPDGRYAQVAVVQNAPGEAAPTRPHRIGIGVYDDRSASDDRSGGVVTGGAVVLREKLTVDLDPHETGGRTLIAELAGAPAGALLLLNDGDLSYSKVRLDPATDLVEVLPRVADPLARAVLWGAAWDACRDGELAASRFVALAGAGLPAETQTSVFETVLRLAGDIATDRYLAEPDRAAAREELSRACRTVLAGAEPGSGRQLAAARGLVRRAGPGDVPWLEGWLAATAADPASVPPPDPASVPPPDPALGPPPGLAIDADLRWLILCRLAVLGAADESRIAAEQRRDRTARGREEATRCRAARPDPQAKRRAWHLIVADRQQSNRIVTAAADGLWRPEHSALTEEYVGRFFAEIGATAGWRPGQMLAAVARAAYPSYAVAAGTVDGARALLARTDLHPVLRREIVDATDDLRRALVARAAAAPLVP